MHKERPIYLFSKTPHSDAEHIPILSTTFLRPSIDFSRYDAIAVTSKQAITALENIDKAWKRLPVLAIADGTAGMVEAHGGCIMQRGGGYGDKLADIIANEYAGMRWLYPRPKRAASDFGRRLKESGVALDEIIVYETSCNEMSATRAIDSDAVLIFTSPFTVECFLKFWHFEKGHQIVVIGETTKAALPEGVDAVMPSSPTIDNSVVLAKQLANLSPSQS